MRLQSEVRSLLSMFLAMLLTFALAEAGARWLDFGSRDILLGPIDLQSDTAVFTKVRELKRHPSPRIFVFGDSVLRVGFVDSGAEKRKTFDYLLREELRPFLPNDTLSVANFATSGALVADIGALVQASLAAKPDVVVININLDQFAHHQEVDEGFTRYYLKNMRIEGDRLTANESAHPTLDVAIESILNRFFSNNFELYRLAHVWAWEYISRTPSKRIGLMIADTLAKGAGLVSLGGRDPDPLSRVAVKNAKANRPRDFETLDWSEKNVQVRAFQRVMAELLERRIPTILFYTRESQAMIVDQAHAGGIAHVRSQLSQLLEPYCQSRTVQCRLDKTLPEEFYIDNIHVDERGFVAWVKELVPLVIQGLGQPPPNFAGQFAE